MEKDVKVYNLKLINTCEEEYNENYPNNSAIYGNINNFYKKVLKIGQGIELDPNDIKEELSRFYEFITTDEFKNKYGRDYNMVDLYLTTNIQPCDLVGEYLNYADKEMYLKMLFFIKDQILSVDNSLTYLQTYRIMNKKQYALRFYKPTKKRIDNLMNLNFFKYNNLDATQEDANKAHDILLDLNDKYGVKYDDISFYIILKSLLNNEIDSYYKVGEEYKELLDKKSHVQKRCIPLLTRREKN